MLPPPIEVDGTHTLGRFAVSARSAGRRSQPSICDAREADGVLRLLDAGVAVGSLVLVLVVLNPPDGLDRLRSFLQMRMTLMNALVLCAAALAWPHIFAAFDLYRPSELKNARIECARIAEACTTGSAFAVMLVLTGANGAFDISGVLFFWLLVTVGTTCARAVARKVAGVVARLEPRTRHIVIVGTGPRARQVYRQVTAQFSCSVVGFVDTVTAVPQFGVPGSPFLGTINDLERILASRPVDAVHICLPVRSCYAAIAQVIATCERVGVESCYDADIFEPSRGRPVGDMTALLVSRKVVTDDYRLWIKRGIDIVGALICLVVLSPIMLAAAVAIRLTSPGRAIFVQERVGFNRRHLKMYKFRTMVVDAAARQAELEHRNEKDGPIFKIQNDPRVTPVGRFLRKTSIDELPQLFHVLKGEMSLVGPRPMAVRDVSRFTEAWLMRRFSVKPGLTCLWQIGGRSNTSFARWVELDLQYIDGWSLVLDLQILARTVPAVLRGAGAV